MMKYAVLRVYRTSHEQKAIAGGKELLKRCFPTAIHNLHTYVINIKSMRDEEGNDKTGKLQSTDYKCLQTLLFNT
jgi:hypothetical protein